MNKKTSLRDKYIKRFYGITGPLDEYKRAQSNRIGNNAFIFLAIFESIMNVIACIFLYWNLTAMIFIGINFLVVIYGVGIYIIMASKKAKLTEHEIKFQNIKQEKHRIIKHSVYAGLYFTIGMYIFQSIFQGLIGNGSIYGNLTSFFNIIIWIIGGFVMGIYMLILQLNRLKKYYK